MESVDKLREACKGHMYTGCDDIPHLICDAFGIGHRPYNWGSVLIPVCDAIEAEIEERYMELPVDADGVPIRVGDKLEYRGLTFDAFSVAEDVVFRECDFNSGRYTVDVYDHSDVRHVKPRTLEDVLEEYYDKRGWDEADNCALNADELTAKYAEEIRELMGGDAE